MPGTLGHGFGEVGQFDFDAHVGNLDEETSSWATAWGFRFESSYSDARHFCMDLEELVNTRRSIRGYKKDPIPREVMDEIIEIAKRAPSSMNTSPGIFTP